MLPVILSNVPTDAKILSEDLFAPVTCLIVVRDDQHAIELTRAGGFGLSASIFGSDKACRQIAAQLHVGSVVINDIIAPTADPRLPFAARGKSGFGATRGPQGLLEMTQLKSTSTRTVGSPMHLEPAHPSDVEMFSAYIKATHAQSLFTRARHWIAFFSIASRRGQK